VARGVGWVHFLDEVDTVVGVDCADVDEDAKGMLVFGIMEDAGFGMHLIRIFQPKKQRFIALLSN
jgi:hypothetical protein